MLIEQTTEFQLKGPGPPGNTCTPITRVSNRTWGVILCCSWKRRKFLFGSVRENVRKNAPEPNKNIRQSTFYASFGSDRRSYSCSGASVRVRERS